MRWEGNLHVPLTAVKGRRGAGGGGGGRIIIPILQVQSMRTRDVKQLAQAPPEDVQRSEVSIAETAESLL